MGGIVVRCSEGLVVASERSDKVGCIDRKEKRESNKETYSWYLLAERMVLRKLVTCNGTGSRRLDRELKQEKIRRIHTGTGNS